MLLKFHPQLQDKLNFKIMKEFFNNMTSILSLNKFTKRKENQLKTYRI